ncbi:MAG: hypothetical protein ACRD0X_07145 [Thermoanaerobaculia bacterium]
MNADTLRELLERLDALDDRLAHRLRPRPSFSVPSQEQLDQRCDELGSYTLELKEIVRDLLRGLAGKG